jgi:ABC-type multidrug transport system fused ATPase/permease subunit
MVLIAGIAVGFKEKVGAAAVGLAFLNASTLSETLTNFIISWTSLETSLGAIARISQFERDTPPETERAPAGSVPDKWPQQGRIKFDNVWATYEEDTEDRSWSLRGLNFEILPGERVALCGQSGSGKSTVLLAMLGMIEMPVGSITIDGIDISSIPLSVLRSQIQVVSQDSFVIADTFREYLDSEGKFTDDEIIKVLQECRIWDRVEAQGGLNGQRDGFKFSTGEAQLFCLAQVLLSRTGHPGGILILDEATSRYVCTPHP